MLIVKGGEKLPEPDIIETPSFGLNYVLGGGLWSGRYHILWGNPQAGKTTFALHTIANAQKLNFTPVIVDAEGSITDQWLDHCGVDTSERVVARSTRLEDILEFIMPKMREKESKYIFLFDSINSIVMEQFYKNDDSTGAIGIYARSQGVLFQKISDLMISNTNHVCLFIAQQTNVSKGQYMAPDAKVGNAATHWATNIVRLTASESAADTARDNDERIVSRKVTWKIAKSKQRPVQGTRGEYWFSPETATIDFAREAFHLAVRNDIIEKKGAWFSYNGQTYQGEIKTLESLGETDIQNILEQLKEHDLQFEKVTDQEDLYEG